MSRGYFAIGILHNKTPANIGTLWRSAHIYDAAFVFTVGARYTPQASDTPKTPRHTPLFHFADFDDLLAHLPHGCPLVGVELSPAATPLGDYEHPDRACYLLGAEDHGIPPQTLTRCHDVVQIEAPKPQSHNVAVAGALLMHDRWKTTTTRLEVPA